VCGIVAGLITRPIYPLLMRGLFSLEYRGYDSAGLSILQDGALHTHKHAGKVAVLSESTASINFSGTIGIAHTRWATHGEPSTNNAQPHVIGSRIAVVHNGIIENYLELKQQLKLSDSDLVSATDTEIAARAIYSELEKTGDLLLAVQQVAGRLKGAFALVVMDLKTETLVTIKQNSSLVIGRSDLGYSCASDSHALLPDFTEFVYLNDGEHARITSSSIEFYARDGSKFTPLFKSENIEQVDLAAKGNYAHFMQKEIFEQPEALSSAYESMVQADALKKNAFGTKTQQILSKVKAVQVIACGSSYFAALLAKHWIEELSELPCSVEVASEFRYRNPYMQPDTLLVAISQSGETADTLSAFTRELDNIVGRLSICNVESSSLVRASDLVCLTNAGREIGVATTKGFTTQIIALLLLTLSLCEASDSKQKQSKLPQICKDIRQLPELVAKILELDSKIAASARLFIGKAHALFLGRGLHYPVALEGALKLKEISYVHAEAYPAGELKHGPLALVDEDMPIVVLAPNNSLLPKLQANIQEVCARGGELLVITEEGVAIAGNPDLILRLPAIPEYLSPIAYTVPLQLLAYHAARLRGADIDKPRNLAKSVTVE